MVVVEVWGHAYIGRGGAGPWPARCGAATPRAARGRAGAATCGLGRHWGVPGVCVGWSGACCGGRAARGRAEQTGWWRCSARTQRARQRFGRQSSGGCGQWSGLGARGSCWGDSGRRWEGPGRAGQRAWCRFGQVAVGWPCPWLGHVGLGFRAWGC